MGKTKKKQKIMDGQTNKVSYRAYVQWPPKLKGQKLLNVYLPIYKIFSLDTQKSEKSSNRPVSIIAAEKFTLLFRFTFMSLFYWIDAHKSE